LNAIRAFRFIILLLCLLPGCSCRENQEAKLKDSKHQSFELLSENPEYVKMLEQINEAEKRINYTER
jgi:hypothetical protein